MIIYVDPGHESSEVREVDDLKRFSVIVAGDSAPEEVVARALAPLGRMESGTHAWVSIEQLRAACARGDDAAWSQSFEAMIAFAASRGWLDEQGEALRAHLEYEPSVR